MELERSESGVAQVRDLAILVRYVHQLVLNVQIGFED
jgi:hypothetical protein